MELYCSELTKEQKPSIFTSSDLLDLEAFFEVNGELYAVRRDYVYFSELGFRIYVPTLLKIEGSVNPWNPQSYTVIETADPTNVVIELKNSLLQHPCFSNIDNLEVFYLQIRDSGNVPAKVYKTNDGIFYIPQLPQISIVGRTILDGWYYIYPFYHRVHLIYKISNSGIEVFSIPLELSWIQDMCPIYAPTYVEYLKDNKFLITNTYSDHLDDYTAYIYNVYHVYDVETNSLITTYQEEPFTLNINDVSDWLNKLGLDVSGFSYYYANGFRSENFENFSTRIENGQVRVLDSFYLYDFYAEIGSFYLESQPLFLKEISIDDNYNFSISKPFLLNNSPDLFSVNSIQSLANTEYFTYMFIYEPYELFSFYYDNKLILVGHYSAAETFDLLDLGAENVLFYTAPDDGYFRTHPPNILIYEKTEDGNFVLSKKYRSFWTEFWTDEIGGSGDYYHFVHSDLPLFVSKKDVPSPGNPPGLVVKQDYNQQICQKIAEKDSSIDFQACLNNTFYKDPVYDRFYSRYKPRDYAALVNNGKLYLWYKFTVAPNISDAQEEYYIIALFSIDLQDESYPICTKIVDAGPISDPDFVKTFEVLNVNSTPSSTKRFLLLNHEPLIPM